MNPAGKRRPTGTILLLLISALLGIVILATDKNIWKDAPLHAYGLVAFVVVDLVLLGLVMMRPTKQTLRIVLGWGLLQIVIMLANIFNGPSTYGSPSDFATYLFGLGYYDSNHIAYLFPALFVVRIVLAAISYMDSKKA